MRSSNYGSAEAPWAALNPWLLVQIRCFFFSSRRRHTRWPRDWSSDVCSSDLHEVEEPQALGGETENGRIERKGRGRVYSHFLLSAFPGFVGGLAPPGAVGGVLLGGPLSPPSPLGGVAGDLSWVNCSGVNRSRIRSIRSVMPFRVSRVSRSVS